MTRAPKQQVVIGDVHGCLDELEQLLAALRFDPRRQQLVFVGDYVDRGPASAGVVRRVRQLTEEAGAVALMGNHDEKYVHHYLHHDRGTGRKSEAALVLLSPAKQAVYASLSPEDLEWLSQRPYYYPGPGFLVVHAGICPLRHRTLEALTQSQEARDRLIRIRKVDEKGHSLRLGMDNVPGARPWWEMYDGRFGPIIHGHWRMDEVLRTRWSTNVDTSCCYGGKLTAMIFEDLHAPAFLQVPARRRYHAPGAP